MVLVVTLKRPFDESVASSSPCVCVCECVCVFPTEAHEAIVSRTISVNSDPSRGVVRVVLL